jgi:hypothetical protein
VFSQEQNIEIGATPYSTMGYDVGYFAHLFWWYVPKWHRRVPLKRVKLNNRATPKILSSAIPTTSTTYNNLQILVLTWRMICGNIESEWFP